MKTVKMNLSRVKRTRMLHIVFEELMEDVSELKLLLQGERKKEYYPEYKREEYSGNPETDYEEKKERWDKREERKRERYDREVGFLKRIFPLRIEGTIVELSTRDEYSESVECEEYTSITEYRSITGGVEVFDEETLIIGKGEESICLVFKKEGNFTNIEITDKIHVVDKLGFDQNSIIQKLLEPAKLPNHLRPLIVINNVTKNIIRNTGNINNISIANGFKSLAITGRGSSENMFGRRLFEDFVKRNYKPGGMCPIKEMKGHPEWIPEFRKEVETTRVNTCKFCKKRWVKGCCLEYATESRTMTTMVIGWHNHK